MDIRSSSSPPLCPSVCLSCSFPTIRHPPSAIRHHRPRRRRRNPLQEMLLQYLLLVPAMVMARPPRPPGIPLTVCSPLGNLPVQASPFLMLARLPCTALRSAKAPWSRFTATHASTWTKCLFFFSFLFFSFSFFFFHLLATDGENC